MDFLERVFHVSPDSGTGALEALYVVAAAVVVAAIVFHRQIVRAIARRGTARRAR